MLPAYRRQILDHLGLVAGMFDELDSGAVIDQATQQNPERPIVTTGHAGKAMVINGLAVAHRRRSRVLLFLQHKPTQRFMAPGITAQPLHDETLGRTLETLYDDGVTERYVSWRSPPRTAWDARPGACLWTAQVSTSMAATTVPKSLTHRSCTGRGVTAGIIALTSTTSCWI